MTILLHKPYLVKVITKGGGGQNAQKFDHVVYGWPLDLKCWLVVHKCIEDRVELKWLALEIGYMTYNVTHSHVLLPEGFVQKIATNRIHNVQTEGPFR